MKGAPKAWFPLYVADFMVDTAALNMEQAGCYMQMLMYSWRTARLPDDDGDLAELCRMSPTRWRRSVADKVRPFFISRDGILTSARLEKERAAALKNSNAQREKSSARWTQKSGGIHQENKGLGDAAALLRESTSPSPIERKKDSESQERESNAREQLRDAAPGGASLFGMPGDDEFAAATAVLAAAPSPPPAPAVPPVPPKPSTRRTKGTTLVNGTAIAFEEFWSLYPPRLSGGRMVKTDRLDAERAFLRALERAPAAAILQAVRNFPFDRAEPQFIPGPSVWLNKGRFLAEVGEVAPRQQDPRSRLGWMVAEGQSGEAAASSANHSGMTIDAEAEA